MSPITRDTDMRQTDTPIDPFVREVLETISRFNMIREKETILVCVSGGPDSVALVRVLLYLKKRLNITTLGIAHLNHGIRGEESDGDEAFTREIAARFCLPFFTRTMDIIKLAKKEHLSLEEAGRNARYDFFATTADANGFTKIAMGHNLDDNAEQVLMNLLRGSGPRGLTGIPPVRENRFIRPLISMTKSRILGFLTAENQPFILDSSNTDQSYLRNKIRHNLIPRLERQFNPEIKYSLDRLSHILRQEEDFLEDQAARALKNCLIGQEASRVRLSIPPLTQNHPAIINRVLRLAIESIKKNLRRITLTHIQDILALMKGAESGKSLDLPGQIRIYKGHDTLLLQKESLPLRQLGRTQKLFRRGDTENPKKKN